MQDPTTQVQEQYLSKTITRPVTRAVLFNVGEKCICGKGQEVIILMCHPILKGTEYKVLDAIGEGAYGVVCSALHHRSGRTVAIKKIAPFEHPLFCLRTLLELKLLKFFGDLGSVSESVSENVSCPLPDVVRMLTKGDQKIIPILDIIKPPSINDFKEVYRASTVSIPCSYNLKLCYYLSNSRTHGNRHASHYSDTETFR